MNNDEMLFADMPRIERPIDKILRYGGGKLSETDLLAIILRADSNTLANKIMRAFPVREEIARAGFNAGAEGTRRMFRQFDYWGERAEADARLAASAPELLAALDALLDMVTDNKTHGPAVLQAANALHKARGTK